MKTKNTTIEESDPQNSGSNTKSTIIAIAIVLIMVASIIYAFLRM